MATNTKNNEPKVLIIIDSIKSGGGAEKNATLLATLLTEIGVSTILLTFNSYPNEYEFNGHRESLNQKSQKSLLKKIGNAVHRVYKINRFCRDNNITHAISFLEEANTYTLLSRILLGNKAKIIVSVRADPTFTKKSKQTIIKWLYKFAYKVVSVSKAIQYTLKKEFKLYNVETIYNPIDQAWVQKKMQEQLPGKYSYLEGERNRPVFVNVGRLCRQKGQLELIKCFARFTKKYPEAILIIIGEGPEYDSLQKYIQDNSLSEKIQLVGHQDNIYPFLKVSDCFLLTSFFEGFPNVILEAAASSLYIISTDCPTGPREIISPEMFNEKMSFPHRVTGASLIEDFNSLDSSIKTPEEILYHEMVWFSENKLRESQTIPVDKFSNQAYLREWLEILT